MSEQETWRKDVFLKFVSVLKALSTFLASNWITSVSLVLSVLSDTCCALLFHGVYFQQFQESWLVTIGEKTTFPVMLLQNKSF